MHFNYMPNTITKRWKSAYLISAAIVCVIIYTAMLGPLRNFFDDRWPYINAFLVSPGRMTINACTLGGLFLCVIQYREFPAVYRRMGMGFALLLVSSLLNAFYGAWALSNRHDLDELIFNVPWRMFVWRWYFTIDVPGLITAIGIACFVWGMASTINWSHEVS